MTEKEWITKLNAKLEKIAWSPFLYRNDFLRKWQIICSFSDHETTYHDHSYQAVNEWNDARRGEKR